MAFKKQTITEVLIDFYKVHGYTYDYSRVIYTGSADKVIIICKEHGEFLQTPNRHKAGRGCPRCGGTGTYTTEEFINVATKVHENKYDYSKSIYSGTHKKVVIVCPEHGEFEQTPDTHMKGHGCTSCGNTSNWGRNNYIKKAKGRECIFYTIRCFNENEEFFKRGITMTSVKRRFHASMPYSYEVISEVKGSADFVYDLEVSEKKRLKDFNYQPLLKFHGSSTECFTK